MATVSDFLKWVESDLSRFSNLTNYAIVEHQPETLAAKESAKVKLYTQTHEYSIIVKEDYLGCIATTRKPRAGEDWCRGNDLPDGPLSDETWRSIMGAIISYELVKIHRPKSAPIPENAA